MMICLMQFGVSNASAADAPEARKYFDWVLQNLSKIEGDMPAISAAAEEAAKRIVDGKDLGIRGEAGFKRELQGRSGQFHISQKGIDGKTGDVIVYAMGVRRSDQPDAAALLDEQLTDAESATAEGSVVIGIVSIEQLRKLDRLERAKKACRFLLDNHAPADDGLVKDADGTRVIPTMSTASMSVAWTLMAETFAGCTRLGHTPNMNKHERVDYGGVRRAKYKGKRFLPNQHVSPIAAGVFGNAYLKELRDNLNTVTTLSWPTLVQTASDMSTTLQRGGKVYVAAFGHSPLAHHGGQLAADPRIFTRLNNAYEYLARPGEKDFVLAITSDWEPASERWRDPELIRRAGRGVAYVISGFRVEPQELRPKERIIDQHWPPGDAIVPVEGYDVRICPSSSIVGESIMWALAMQVSANLHNEGRE